MQAVVTCSSFAEAAAEAAPLLPPGEVLLKWCDLLVPVLVFDLLCIFELLPAFEGKVELFLLPLEVELAELAPVELEFEPLALLPLLLLAADELPLADDELPPVEELPPALDPEAPEALLEAALELLLPAAEECLEPETAVLEPVLLPADEALPDWALAADWWEAEVELPPPDLLDELEWLLMLSECFLEDESKKRLGKRMSQLGIWLSLFIQFKSASATIGKIRKR